MEYDPDGTHQLLIEPTQEKTARRTRHLLMAARFTFFFSHGLLIISASWALGWQTGSSWWLVFLPVWIGDGLCLLLVVLSWFGSCPYIHLCLHERQARLGDQNPSILTDILPDVFFGVICLVYMTLALVAELLLCRHLEHLQKERGETPTACAVFLIIVSLLTFCRGLCILTSSMVFGLLGSGALASSILGIVFSNQPVQSVWVVFLPWLPVVMAVQLSLCVDFKRQRAVLCREEVLLRLAELVLLCVVFLALLVVVLELSPYSLGWGTGFSGIVLGAGVCCLALLRARMVLAESRFGLLPERLLSHHLRAVEALSMRSSVISGVGAEVTLHASSVTPTAH